MSRISSFPRCALFGLALFGFGKPAPAMDGNKLPLAPQWKKGQTDYVQLEDKVETHTKGGRFGEEGRKTTSQRLRCAKRVVESTGKGEPTQLRFTFDRFAIQSTGGRAALTFDSDVDDPKDTANVGAVFFGPMLGMSFTLDVTADRKVAACKGFDEIFDKVEGAAAGNPLFNQMQDDLTDEFNKMLWGELRLSMYPDDQVHIAEGQDRWSRTLLSSGVFTGDIAREFECTLDKITSDSGRQIAHIKYAGEIKQPKNAKKGARLFMMQMEKITGKIEGTAEIDFGSGALLKQVETVTLSIDGSASGPGPDDVAKMHIDSTTIQTMTLMTEAERNAQRSSNKEAAAKKTAEESKPAAAGG